MRGNLPRIFMNSAMPLRSKDLMTHLTNTIMLADSREPHAQHHSNGTSMIANAIAEEMGLDRDTQEAAALAASLMNVGKIKASRQCCLRRKF